MGGDDYVEAAGPVLQPPAELWGPDAWGPRGDHSVCYRGEGSRGCAPSGVLIPPHDSSRETRGPRR